MHFFHDFLAGRGIEVSETELPDFNILGSQRLDSFEVLSLIMELELNCGERITVEDLLHPDSKTISGLIKTLLEK